MKMDCFSGVEYFHQLIEVIQNQPALERLDSEFWDPLDRISSIMKVIEADEERKSEIDWEASCPEGFTGSAFILVLLTGLSEILILPIIEYTINWLT